MMKLALAHCYFLTRLGFTYTGRYIHRTDTGAHSVCKYILHDSKTGVWYSVSTDRIGLILFRGTINSERHVQHIIQPYFESLIDEPWYTPFQ